MIYTYASSYISGLGKVVETILKDKIKDVQIIENQDGLIIYKTNNSIIDLEKSKLAFMGIELSNKVVLLEEVSTGEYTADTKVRIVNPESLGEKQYISTEDVAKSVYTSENKIAINFGAELHIISKSGILLKKYILAEGRKWEII